MISRSPESPIRLLLGARARLGSGALGAVAVDRLVDGLAAQASGLGEVGDADVVLVPVVQAGVELAAGDLQSELEVADVFGELAGLGQAGLGGGGERLVVAEADRIGYLSRVLTNRWTVNGVDSKE